MVRCAMWVVGGQLSAFSREQLAVFGPRCFTGKKLFGQSLFLPCTHLPKSFREPAPSSRFEHFPQGNLDGVTAVGEMTLVNPSVKFSEDATFESDDGSSLRHSIRKNHTRLSSARPHCASENKGRHKACPLGTFGV